MDKRFTHRKVDLKNKIKQLERALKVEIWLEQYESAAMLRDDILFMKQIYEMVYLTAKEIKE